MKPYLPLVFCFLLAGCVSQPGWSLLRPGTWFQGRAAAAVVENQTQETKVADTAVTAAHEEIFKTTLALADAPASLQVEVARRTAGNAVAILNQREPLSAAKVFDAQTVVKGLLARVTTAEAAQQKAEGNISALAEQLESIRTQAKKLADARDAEAAKNLELANELRNERFLKYGGMALSGILGLAAFAYRANLFSLQGGVANGLAALHAKLGAGDTSTAAIDTLQHEIDALTTPAHQSKIASMVEAAIGKNVTSGKT